jgi:glycosyltransferase involved in cell wall biosynthesis
LREKEELPALCIATNPGCVAGLKLQNVRLLTDVVLENFGDVMKRSEFMVLSLKDTELSAGHQVLLEALKNNVLVLVNQIPAICDYVSDRQVMFYESGNVQDLQDKIQDILYNYGERKAQYGNNRAYYEANYTFEALLRRLVEINWGKIPFDPNIII